MNNKKEINNIKMDLFGIEYMIFEIQDKIEKIRRTLDDKCNRDNKKL